MHQTATLQPGILALGTPAHHHLEFTVTNASDLLNIVCQVRDELTTVAGVNVVVGFAPSLWAALSPSNQPEDLADFSDMEANGIRLRAAQHDMWVWLHGASTGSVLDAALQAKRTLAGSAELVAEQQSFGYGASQDLTGFEDGTENPPIDEAPAVISLPASSPAAGASIALLQRWVHDLDAFAQMDEDTKERVVGRTLVGSVEFDDNPPRAHVERVVVEDDDGEEREIFRRSTAFGGASEHGLMFVGFSGDPTLMRVMLQNMIGQEDGVTDYLTDISTASASAWYVVPTLEQLRR